jgi:hypothetical protein
VIKQDDATLDSSGNNLPCPTLSYGSGTHLEELSKKVQLCLLDLIQGIVEFYNRCISPSWGQAIHFSVTQFMNWKWTDNAMHNFPMFAEVCFETNLGYLPLTSCVTLILII